jgi:hypothetical protein
MVKFYDGGPTRLSNFGCTLKATPIPTIGDIWWQKCWWLGACFGIVVGYSILVNVSHTFGEANYLPYEPNSEPKSVHQLSYIINKSAINPNFSWSNRHFPIVKSHISYGFLWFPMGAPRIGTPPTFPSSPSSVSVAAFTVVALVELPVTSTCTGRTGWLKHAQMRTMVL